MMRIRVVAGMIWFGAVGLACAQSTARTAFDAFEVATVKPVDVGPKSGRTFHMDGTHRWIAENFTLEALIALGFDMNPKTISGGPAWVRSQKFVITALTPGDVAPTRLEQMTMLRDLLVERFALKFHRQAKTMKIYELTVMKGGPKLRDAARPDEAPKIVGIVHPEKVEVPARSVSMDDFVAMLQRAVVDLPTVNRTGLAGRYDFDLVFAPDETVYGGELAKPAADASDPPLFAAVQEQLGLTLKVTRGAVSTMWIDSVARPSAD